MVRSSIDNWKWEKDHSLVSFDNWDRRYPAQWIWISGDGDCARVEVDVGAGGKWWNGDCGEVNYVICEKSVYE